MTRTLERRARTPLIIDVNDPRAVAACDGCGFLVNHKDLKKDMQYRGGSTPVWTGFLVCTKCLDVPNQAPQFKRITLPPDPVPVENPRPDVPTPTYSGFKYWVDDSGRYITVRPGDDAWGNEYVQTVTNPSYP